MKSQSRHRTEASNPTSSVELLLNFKNLTKLKFVPPFRSVIESRSRYHNVPQILCHPAHKRTSVQTGL